MHLVGVTELGRILGNDPNMALSVLYGFGRCEAGRSRVGEGQGTRAAAALAAKGGAKTAVAPPAGRVLPLSRPPCPPPPRPQEAQEAPPLRE